MQDEPRNSIAGNPLRLSSKLIITQASKPNFTETIYIMQKQKIAEIKENRKTYERDRSQIPIK
jgi:hypothetical protein